MVVSCCQGWQAAGVASCWGWRAAEAELSSGQQRGVGNGVVGAGRGIAGEGGGGYLLPGLLGVVVPGVGIPSVVVPGVAVPGEAEPRGEHHGGRCLLADYACIWG
jgi:hypothetical protein